MIDNARGLPFPVQFRSLFFDPHHTAKYLTSSRTAGQTIHGYAFDRGPTIRPPASAIALFDPDSAFLIIPPPQRWLILSLNNLLQLSLSPQLLVLHSSALALAIPHRQRLSVYMPANSVAMASPPSEKDPVRAHLSPQRSGSRRRQRQQSRLINPLRGH